MKLFMLIADQIIAINLAFDKIFKSWLGQMNMMIFRSMMMMMIVWVYGCWLNALFQGSIPCCSNRTGFTSQCLSIPDWFFLITNTYISTSRITLTSITHIIINSSGWTRLTLISCHIPKWICSITINSYTFICFEAKYLFLTTTFINFNTFFVFFIILLSSNTLRNT